MITLDLFGAPIAQKRPKFFKRGSHVGCYDEQKKVKEGYIWQLKSLFKEEPFNCPLEVWIIFYMPIPKSTTKTKRKQMINGLLSPMCKPDVDNMVKFYFDCMNGVVFKDDAQVVELRTKKIYSEKPRTIIRVFPLANSDKETLYENCAREDGWGSLSRNPV